VARAFRRTALPLAAYYAVTLAVPLANGAAQSGAFVEHALAVFVVPLVAVIAACAIHGGGVVSIQVLNELAAACGHRSLRRRAD
jgi:hypothetical protein